MQSIPNALESIQTYDRVHEISVLTEASSEALAQTRQNLHYLQNMKEDLILDTLLCIHVNV